MYLLLGVSAPNNLGLGLQHFYKLQKMDDSLPKKTFLFTSKTLLQVTYFTVLIKHSTVLLKLSCQRRMSVVLKIMLSQRCKTL